MEQKERISYFENILDEGEELVDRFNKFKEAYENYLTKLKELESYYTSSIYMSDLKDDNEGKLPAYLKRGILSEDSIYNLLINTDNISKALEIFEHSEE